MELCGTGTEGGGGKGLLVRLHEGGQLGGELACVDGEVALVGLAGLQVVQLQLNL